MFSHNFYVASIMFASDWGQNGHVDVTICATSCIHEQPCRLSDWKCKSCNPRALRRREFDSYPVGQNNGIVPRLCLLIFVVEGKVERFAVCPRTSFEVVSPGKDRHISIQWAARAA